MSWPTPTLPGVTHAKRWQDIDDLLEAGIDVYTTLNVQHLESLNDVVAQITGVTVRETVPDTVFEQADEVELVDLAPDDLIERLREGKVYVPQQARAGHRAFLSKGQPDRPARVGAAEDGRARRCADGDYRHEHKIEGTWPVGRAAAGLRWTQPDVAPPGAADAADGGRAPRAWIAAHVESPTAPQLAAADQERLNHTIALASQLGGETVTLSGTNAAEEIVRYARDRNVTRIIVGKSLQPRWKELLRGSLVYELTRRSGDIDVYVISGDTETDERVAPPPAEQARAAFGLSLHGRGDRDLHGDRLADVPAICSHEHRHGLSGGHRRRVAALWARAVDLGFGAGRGGI